MFQFRHFNLDDSHATMKLGTDAVLLGVLATPTSIPHRILDIGTGSGIIALMMAQRFPDAVIDAIDIDEETIQVATKNFQDSPWSQRLKAHHLSLHDFSEGGIEHTSLDNQYDLIVSNPPYFSHSLKNDNPRKRMARHDDTLPLEQLFNHSSHLLAPNGTLAVILPLEQQEPALTHACQNGLNAVKLVTIHNRPGDPAKRIVFNFQKKEAQENEALVSEKLFMRNEDNSYSDAYIALTAEFYLWLHP